MNPARRRCTLHPTRQKSARAAHPPTSRVSTVRDAPTTRANRRIRSGVQIVYWPLGACRRLCMAWNARPRLTTPRGPDIASSGISAYSAAIDPESPMMHWPQEALRAAARPRDVAACDSYRAGAGLRTPKTAAKICPLLRDCRSNIVAVRPPTASWRCCAATGKAPRFCCAVIWTRCRCAKTPACRSPRGRPAPCTPVGTTVTWPCWSARPGCCAAGAGIGGHGAVHVSARRGGLAWRPLHVEDGLLDPLPDCRIRAACNAQCPARGVHQPRRAPAGLGRYAAHPGQRSGRACIDAP